MGRRGPTSLYLVSAELVASSLARRSVFSLSRAWILARTDAMSTVDPASGTTPPTGLPCCWAAAMAAMIWA